MSSGSKLATIEQARFVTLPDLKFFLTLVAYYSTVFGTVSGQSWFYQTFAW
jgi:hypothetical protein